MGTQWKWAAWAVMGALGSVGTGAWAQNKADVDMVLSAVKQAYPNPKALCSGGPDSVKSAVAESLRAVAPQIKGNANIAAQSATMRLLESCPR